MRELQQTDRPCPFCSASIEVGYEQERVTMHCPECPGLFGEDESTGGRPIGDGNLGYRPLPSAAIDGRTAGEMHDVSKTWTALMIHGIGRGVCPRCSGRVTHSVAVCESHDGSDGPCDRCGHRFEALASASCTNCPLDIQPGIAGYLLTRSEVMAFLIDNGIDPIAVGDFHPYAATEETILSHSPFEARYSFTVNDDSLTVTVDDDLSVVAVTRGEPAGAND